MCIGTHVINLLFLFLTHVSLQQGLANNLKSIEERLFFSLKLGNMILHMLGTTQNLSLLRERNLCKFIYC